MSLSDKHRDVLGQQAKVYDYASEDVRESFKRLIEFLSNKHPHTMTCDEYIQKAKEIFGERF